MTHAPVGLAIFDIDGTLTATNAVDTECYAQAVADVLGVTGISTDWGSYKHSTDSAMLAEIVETNSAHAPSLRDIRSVRSRFIDLIESRSRQGEGFAPVRGADRVIRALRECGWTCAVATGGWGPSARRKLESAGVRAEGIAIATADDAFARTDIIEWAARRACAEWRTTRMPRVYVGDGRWDVVAARASGCGFVGIGSGERASQLVAAGAGAVLEDFQDQAQFIAAMQMACSVAEAR